MLVVAWPDAGLRMVTPPAWLHPDLWRMFFWEHRWLIGLSYGALFLISLVIRVRRSRRVSQSHAGDWGAARWAKTPELREMGLLKGRGLMLGRWRSSWWRQMYIQPSEGGHVAVFSPSQPRVAGKTRSFIVPSVLAWGGSAVLNDVKGELYPMTARERAQLGPVYRVNPNALLGSCDTMNPWNLLRWGTDREVGDVQRFGRQLSQPTAPPTQITEYWRGEGTDIITTVMLYIHYDPLNSYRRSLAGLHDFFTDLHHGMRQQIDRLKASNDPEVQNGIATFVESNTPPEQVKAWKSAITNLRLWRDPLIAGHTDTHTVPIETFQFGARPQTLYLQFTPEDLKGRLRPLARILWQSLLTLLTDRDVQDYDWPLFVGLDEFAAMGHLPPIEDLFAIAAGYGIWGGAALQSPSQLYASYGDNTAILNNCAYRIFFSQNDYKAAELCAKLLGESTVEEVSTHRSGSRWGGWTRHGEASRSHGRPLRFASEIMELPPDEIIIRAPSMKPILAKKIRFESWHFRRWVRRYLRSVA
jgi:type IV secretion system protein VirD4